MKPDIVLAHKFVEFIPEELQERTLYISTSYGTAVHKCCCGCGREVVTPLSPAGWQVTYDGKWVSLYPSIGSWSLPCQSHYFITENKVVWAAQWSPEQIARGRKQEARARAMYYSGASSTDQPTQENRPSVPAANPTEMQQPPAKPTQAKRTFWTWLKSWWS